MSEGEEVMKLLQILAKQSGESVSPDRLEFTARRITGIVDHAKLCSALEALIETTRRFPLVSEIKTLLGLAPQRVEDQARDVAERIYTALGRGWASSLNKDIQATRDAFVGPIGVRVVMQQGGWSHMSAIVMADDATTWKAQWRGLAEVVIKRGPDAPDIGPQWDRLPTGEKNLARLELPNIIDIAKRRE